jgi:hypothetical protein
VARYDLIPAIRKDVNYFYAQRFNLLTSVSADLLRRPSAAATSLHETRDGEAL